MGHRRNGRARGRAGTHFTIEELKEASRRLPAGKSPGADGVPNEILRVVASAKPSIFLNTFNACWRGKRFPARWNAARLILIHKGPRKPVGDLSSFRPLCMLDGVGKMLERPDWALTYRVTQAMTRHGCFRHYLRRMKRASDVKCIYCDAEEDTAEHTIFVCPQWSAHRLPLRLYTGGWDPIPENVEDLFCGLRNIPGRKEHPALHERLLNISILDRQAFTDKVEVILSQKEDDERETEICGQRRRRLGRRAPRAGP